MHGAVVRKEALQWRNGRYTWDAEEEDDSELDQCWRCFAADCPHVEFERMRIKRARLWAAQKVAGYPPKRRDLNHPLVLARLAGLKEEALNAKLHVAVRNMSTDLIALCVEAGAKLEWTDSRGMTALHVAASMGCTETCEALLLLGAQPNARTPSNATALHFVADLGAAMPAHELIAAGALVNAQDERNNTPLHLAAMENCNASVAHLLSNGADPWMRNGDEVCVCVCVCVCVFVITVVPISQLICILIITITAITRTMR